ncbi:MAG: lycopene beta-cyclase CrtY [Deltaproteobacteria bacterium]|nr:lycopene beta-cyclase CrtY [Deltaproteobacteria bacterium]
MPGDFDYALVGGGLQNGLIALAVRAHQPDARIAIIERAPALAGNHTWCFHDSDLPPAMAAWLAPAITARWIGHDVAFPGHRRALAGGYACVAAEDLATAVTAALDQPGSALRTRTSAETIAADHVVVRNPDNTTETIRASAVIAARGPDAAALDAATGWQKFLGQEVRTTGPHGLVRPMLMDATVPQVDGFRFVYVLPLAPDRLLIEDTYFSDSAHLDAAHLRGEIGRYALAHGWPIAEVLREETGVLPLPWRMPDDLPAAAAPLVAGYAGGWFHPVTGYSFPIAARVAAHVAARPAADLHGADRGALDDLARQQRKQLGFALRLNWMLFRWFPPDQRYHVLERFYRLPEATIRRFYALELTAFDRARILIGRPPRGMSWRAALALGEAR